MSELDPAPLTPGAATGWTSARLTVKLLHDRRHVRIRDGPAQRQRIGIRRGRDDAGLEHVDFDFGERQRSI